MGKGQLYTFLELNFHIIKKKYSIICNMNNIIFLILIFWDKNKKVEQKMLSLIVILCSYFKYMKNKMKYVENNFGAFQ